MIDITTLSELTIDGKLSLGPRASSKDLFNFYGDELRAWFHGQRAATDAIMVGSNTIRNDDPELTVRYATGANPLRIVPASEGCLPLNARVLNDGLPTVVAVSRQAPAEVVAELAAKPQVEVVRCGEERVDLRELISLLERRGIASLIVEGGSRLLHSFFEAELVSRIIVKHIPVICGSQEAPTYLIPEAGAMRLPLSRWRVEDWFMKGGVGVSIYRPLRTSS